jgi:subtilisin family serine protease
MSPKWEVSRIPLSISLLLCMTAAYPATVAEQYAPGQVIIQLAPDCRDRVNAGQAGKLLSFGVEELDRLNERWQVRRVERLVRNPHPNPALVRHGVDLMYLLTVDSSADIGAMAADYRSCPRVAYAGPNLLRPSLDVPNDPSFGVQWHLANIRAPEAWDFSHGDTSVRIGVVDGGIDYTHPDIAANLWVNGPEDINHNGRFDPEPSPAGDLDGIDQDSNGYVDDVIGYDFLDDDPDPMPHGTNLHGTHCLGITNAVTNNDTGIASIGWGCRGMAFRTGDSGHINIAAAIAAIAYAVDQHCWVTSHSYSSTSSWPPESTAMEAARDAGLVLCASAGNDGNSEYHYPAAYPFCVAVAASDRQDKKALFSCYGDWVDVTSPGVDIYSTIPVWLGSYGLASGTSMSAPLVAGLAALMKSANPGITNQQCIDNLRASADSMMDPYFQQGLLGGGRINALKAVAIGQRCRLTVSGHHLNDPNGNGIPEPGETLGLTVTLSNRTGWRDATSVSAVLSCSDPDVTILKPGATFPDIPNGDSGTCAADSFVFRVNANAVSHLVTFHIAKTATPASFIPNDSVILQVGRPGVLIVDDRGGWNSGRFYEEACDSLGVLYERYNTGGSGGAPSADTLRHYPTVIWFTNLDSTEILSRACRTALTAFLDSGGSLFICGQSIGQAIDTTAFYANYLKAQFVTPSTQDTVGIGLPGDPIGNGDTFFFGGIGGTHNANSCDGIRPIGGSYGCITYLNYPDTTVYAAIRYAGGFKMVYFAAPFEAIAAPADRSDLMRRILTFLGVRLPGIVAEPQVGTFGGPRLTVAPNPVRERAEIRYSVARTQLVTIRVYDARGSVVRTLHQGNRDAGSYRATWDLRTDDNRAVANGVYFCSVAAGNDSRGGKLLVTR